MFKTRKPELEEAVWAAVADIGRSAPRIADAIIGEVFPKTLKAAKEEGAERIFRNGLIFEVKRIIHQHGDDDEDTPQGDFSHLDPSFQPLAYALKRASYYAPKYDFEFTVDELIEDLEKLDDARKFMRKKGMECLAEANRLDQLYNAVLAKIEERKRRTGKKKPPTGEEASP